MNGPRLKIENAGPEKARLRLALILLQTRRAQYASDYNYLLLAKVALIESKAYFDQMDQRRAWLYAGYRLGSPLPSELVEWVVEPVTLHLKGQTWTA